MLTIYSVHIFDMKQASRKLISEPPVKAPQKVTAKQRQNKRHQLIVCPNDCSHSWRWSCKFLFCFSVENSVVRLLKSNGQPDELKFIKIVVSLDKIRRIFWLWIIYIHHLLTVTCCVSHLSHFHFYWIILPVSGCEHFFSFCTSTVHTHTSEHTGFSNLLQMR